MTFIQHKPCATDVVFKRVGDDSTGERVIRIWCPTCGRAVAERELTRRGPYSAYLTAGAVEEEA